MPPSGEVSTPALFILEIMKIVFIWFFGVVLLPVMGQAQNGHRTFIEVRDMTTDSLIIRAEVASDRVHELAAFYGPDTYLIESPKKPNRTEQKKRPYYALPSFKPLTDKQRLEYRIKISLF